MARHPVTREPRYHPAPKIIGAQPDLFGGPTVTHEVPRRPVPNNFGRQLLAYHLADHIADLENDHEAAPQS